MVTGNESFFQYPLSDAAYIATGIYLTIMGSVAFFGNVFVIVVLIWGKPNFIRAQRVLILTIAVSNLGVSCIAYPLTAASGFYKKWIFSDTVCVLNGFVVYTLSIVKINALAVMAVVRYIVLCRQDLRYLLKGKYPGYALLGIWLYALFWSIGPLVGWSNYQPESFGTSCTLHWSGIEPVHVSYNVLCIVFCYVVHVVVICYSYRKVLKAISGMNEKTVRRNMTEAAERGVPSEKILQYKKILESRKMALVCFGTILGFLICWTPYAVITVWNITRSPVSPEVQVLPTMFCKLSSLLNPFIYAASCDRFREAAVRLFHKPFNVIGPTERPQSVANTFSGNVQWVNIGGIQHVDIQ